MHSKIQTGNNRTKNKGRGHGLIQMRYIIGICLMLLTLIIGPGSVKAQIITTVAGNGFVSYSGDGGALEGTQLSNPTDMVYDAAGNLYFADAGNNVIRKITPSGTISTVVGTGIYGNTGNGGAATAARIGNSNGGPTIGSLGLAIDGSGNIYIADGGNNVVRMVNPSGIISNFAGNSTRGYTGNGGAATAAQLSNPTSLAIDGSGNLLIADQGNCVIRMVNTSGVISTIAGTHSFGNSGDGGAPTSATFKNPSVIKVDASGSIYIVDGVSNVVRKISSSIIRTVAGNGSRGFSGDGGAGTAANLSNPSGLVIDGSGNLYIEDQSNYRIRKVNASGIISTIAGNGTNGFSGDGGAATAAMLSGVVGGPSASPNMGLAIDGSGNLLIADRINNRIRRINTSGIISTLAGGLGFGNLYSQTSIAPYDVKTDASGNIFMVDLRNNCIRKINSAGIVSIVAGTGVRSFSGDGGPATNATLSQPTNLDIDASGNIYISDNLNNRIRVVNTSGIISTIAGNGLAGTAAVCGDDGPATNANLNQPNGVAVDPAGNIYIADYHHMRVRKVNTSGFISTYAGDGTMAFGGDGGSATNAQLTYPNSLSLDPSGNLYISTYNNYRVRKVTTAGVISTVAGNGTTTQTGEGIIATTTGLAYPQGVTTDASGNIYISTPGDNRVIKVTSTGIETTYAGNGTGGFAGDGGPATAASLNNNVGLYCDGSGVLYIADYLNQRIRKVTGSTLSGITGPSIVCQGASITLSDTTSGGVWSSGNTSIAIIGSLSGSLTGLGVGTAIITYTAGTDFATKMVVVKGAPGPITGSGVVCQSASILLSDSTIGGVWTSSNSGIATIASASGSVTGVAAGTAIISYSTGCGATVAKFVNVIGDPSPITGVFTICSGAITALSDAITSGYWTSSNISVATIDTNTGLLTGVSAGTTIITYSNGCGTAAFQTVTVVGIPATISGTTSLCQSGSTTLSNSVTGGSWSSSSIGVATIGTLTGIVTGISAGTAIVTYSTGCGLATFTTLTVHAPPGAITGTATICVPGNTTLFNASTGGTWSSSSTGIATANPSTGVITGVSPGTAIIQYSNGCGTPATRTVTVNAAAGTTSGASSVCLSGTTTFTNSVPGGTWVSSNPGIASIGSLSGVISGVSVGTANITYNLGCGAPVISSINVISAPPTITGSPTVCIGGQDTLTDAVGAGIWTSGNTVIATVGSLNGVVTGISSGTVVISYTIACGTATKVVTIITGIPPISGPNSVCMGSAISLSNAIMGGTWSVSTTNLIIGSAGLATGISAGTSTVTYSVGGSCLSTTNITVNPVSSITGPTTVCVGSRSTLFDSVSGGLWTSSNTAVATINCNQGIVNGVNAGTSIISYSLATGCTKSFVITAISLAANSGNTSLCTAATTTLTNIASGGIWSSNNTSVATVDSITGVVTGIASGNVFISYSIGAGCSTKTGITVFTLTPNTGISSVCAGSAITLSNITMGGTWSSSNMAIAGVVSGTGVVSGVTLGTAIISYTFGSSCVATTPVQVNSIPATVTVSGAGAYCGSGVLTASGGSGGIMFYEGTTSGGTSVGIPSSTQTITTSGLYYFRSRNSNGCWGAEGSATVTINSISGTLNICPGSATLLASTGGSGTWSSSNTSVATIGTTGLVTAIATGSTLITRTLSTGCIITTTLNVSTPPVISGPGSVCDGQSITLSNIGIGGTWSSSTPTVATVGANTGVVNGIAPGLAATITYTFGLGCYATKVVSVNALGSINTPPFGCVGKTITLTNGTTGGTWISGNTGIATVNSSTGVVTGVTAGTTQITYSLSTGCTATTTVSIRTLTSTTGPTTVCVGQTITLSNTTCGGKWSTSSPTILTIGSSNGLVTGIAGALAAPVTYTLGSGCSTIFTVSVNPIYGILGTTTVCQGLTTTLSNSVPGGTWGSSNAGIAPISTTGLVTGVGSGIVTISYQMPTGCLSTIPVYINPVAPITGPSSVCLGQSMQLTENAGAGTWSSSAVSVATIGSTGIVKGIAPNLSTTITYTFCTGCKTTKIVSVNPLSIISGATSVCQGLITTMTDATPGGTWSSSAAGVLNFASTNGNVTGVGAGTATISYILPTGCTSAMTMTVNPLSPISGPNGVCYQKTIVLTNLVPGGAWASAAAAIASVVSSSGIVTGATAANNSTTITYTTSAGCKATKVVSVYALPATPPAIGGPATVSISGATITLTNATTGGTWTSGNPARATVVSTTGVVTGVGLGTVVITYTVANAAGCTNQVTKVITVGPIPPPHTVTTKTVSINIDATFALFETVKGGIWSCNDCDGIVSLNTESGTLTGITQGRATITYTVNDEISSSITITKVIVNPLPESVITFNKEGNVHLIPNPNKGSFILKGNLATTADEEIAIVVSDVLGQTIFKGNAKAIEGKINEQVELSNTLANGMYLLNLYSSNEHYVFHFVVER